MSPITWLMDIGNTCAPRSRELILAQLKLLLTQLHVEVVMQ